MVGDSEADLRLAAALGLRGERVGTAVLGRPAPSRGLAEAVQAILGDRPTS